MPLRMTPIAGCAMTVAMCSVVTNAHEYFTSSAQVYPRLLRETRNGTVLCVRLVNLSFSLTHTLPEI